MAETLDVNIISDNIIDVQDILQYVNVEFDVDIKVIGIKRMDNWKYENSFQIVDNKKIISYIDDNKIIWYDMKISYDICCGIYIEKTFDKYCTCFWVDTKELYYLLNNKSLEIFDSICNALIAKADIYKITLAAIGIESSFEYSGSDIETIKNCSDILRWMIFNSNITQLNGFVKINELNNCKIFSC